LSCRGKPQIFLSTCVEITVDRVYNILIHGHEDRFAGRMPAFFSVTDTHRRRWFLSVAF
jgi:hypothetical protein